MLLEQAVAVNLISVSAYLMRWVLNTFKWMRYSGAKIGRKLVAMGTVPESVSLMR